MSDEANDAVQTNTDADTGAESSTETEVENTAETQDAVVESSQAEGSEAESSEQKESDGESFIGAPEAYEPPEMPEGMAVDEAALEAFKEFAKAEDISQVGFSKLAQFYADLQQKGNEQYMESLLTAARQQQESWITEIKQDKEIGGANYEKTVKQATSAVNRFEKEAPGLKQLLDPYDPETNPNGTGLANNPVMVKLFQSIDKLIGNDNPGQIPNGVSGGTEAMTTEEWLREGL